MTTRVIDTELQRERLFLFLKGQSFPFTINVIKGRKRSVGQNRLQRKWMNEVADQLGDRTPEEVRGECKLTMGVPILRAENDIFCESYDRVVKPLTYEAKLAIMMEPLDMPITRLMTTGQKTRYLDHVYRYWAERGLVLTMPEHDPEMVDAGGAEITRLGGE